MFTPVTNVSSTAPNAANTSVPASSSASATAAEASPMLTSTGFGVNTGGRTSPIVHSTSSGRPPPQGEALRSLIQDRQREVSDLHALEVAGLEKQVHEQKMALEDAAKQQETLAADFAFNLTLIAERDAELSAFETAFQDLRQELHDRDGALSASMQQCASLQEALLAAEQQVAARQQSERLRAKQARQQVDEAKWAGDATARSERDKAEAARQALAVALEERDALVARERAEVRMACGVRLQLGSMMSLLLPPFLHVIGRASNAKPNERNSTKTKALIFVIFYITPFATFLVTTRQRLRLKSK